MLPAPGQGMIKKKKLVTLEMRASMLEGEQHLIVEKLAPNVSQITINRPECNNLLTHRTRAQLFNQLQMNDQDPDIRVTIIRGAGGNFSAGNDFDTNNGQDVLPFFEAEMDGQTSRHVLNGWLMINDLAKPVVAMVEGEAIGGGLELAAACDVCICAENASIGYGAVRGQGLADYQVLPWMCGMRNAMELLLTNGMMTGIEAAKRNFATMCVPQTELESKTLDLAMRIAKIPSDLLAFNKKSVHRAFEAQGMRTNLRNGVDLEALMFKAPGAKSLTVRRGVQRGKPVAQRTPPPRPTVGANAQAAVAAQVVSANPEAVPAAAAPKTAAPKPVAAAPKPVAAAPKPVAAAPKPVAAAPKPAAAKPVAAAPKPVAAAPKPVAAAPKPAAAKPAAAPKPAAAKAVAVAAPKKEEATSLHQQMFEDDVDEDSLDIPADPRAKAAPKPVVAAAPKAVAAAPKPAAPKPVTAAPKPVAKPVAAAPKAASAKPIAAAAAPKPVAEVQKKEGGLHVYIKEGVHFHFGKSKL